MQRLNVQPNTPEWLEARKLYRTASEAAIVCGRSPFTSREKFKLIRAGLAKQYYSKAMQQGHEQEEQIRAWANEKLNKTFSEEVWVNGKYLASIDGIDGDTLIEIKTSSRTYQDIVSNKSVPDYYMLQIQQQLFCTPAKHGYLVAYCPKLEQYAVSQRIEADPEAMLTIEQGWEAFDALPVPEGDIDASDNVDLEISFRKYAKLKAQADQLSLEMGELKETILQYASSRTVTCRGFSIVYKKGATKTDYKKACVDARLDLAAYQSVGEPSYMLTMAAPDFEADANE
jgi:putative phage-type endonuclease